MDKKVVVHPPIHLLALTLSEDATAQVELLRRHLWQEGGDLLSLALYPLIPLKWSSSPLPPFEHLELPLMPQKVTFDQVDKKEEVLYLESSDQSYLEVVDEIKGIYPTDDLFSYPFPPANGILLGPGEWRGEASQVVNNDWRVIYLEIGWHTLEGQLLHLNHQISTNRHLLSLNL